MHKKKFVNIIISTFLFFSFFATAHAQSLGTTQKLKTPITLHMENVPLKVVLNKIAEKANLQLVFSETFIPANRIVTVNFNGVAAGDALKQVLAQTSTDYKITGAGQVVLVPTEDSSSKRHAKIKNGTIAGFVYDNETGDPLVGANVYLENTSFGAATNDNGMFFINNIPPGTYKVVVNYVGYTKRSSSVTVEAGDKVKLNFSLQPSLMDLDEIIVTGNRSGAEKRALANPVTVISQDELQLMPISTVNDIFEGRIPSGYSLDIGFNNRDRQTIAIRGSQAFTTYNNTVKTYIDGVEVADFGYSALASLNFDDIDRIEVLRGPMASTLYGSGASGGIIQIFTKKGRGNKTRINFKGYGSATSSDYVKKTPYGQNYAVNISAGSSERYYKVNLSHSVDDLPYPNNGIKDKKWRLSSGVGVTNGPLMINIEAGFGSSVYGSVNNPLLLKLKEERGWTRAPKSLGKLYDRKYTNNSQLASINIRHVIKPNWYQKLTLGYNKTKIINTSLSPDLVWYFDPDSGWTQIEKYYYLNRSWTKRSLNYLTNAKLTFAKEFSADLTAGVEHTISDVDYLNTNLDVNPEVLRGMALDNGLVTNYEDINTGYYGEAVLGYKNKLFFTAGLRLEDNSNYGDEYGLDKNPRLGLSYVLNLGKFQIKPRGAWGRSTKAPLVTQKDYQETAYAIFLANPDLGPETQSGYEVGTDFYFGDIFSFELTYYDQVVKNGITPINVDNPDTPKREYQYQNINEFFNKGWEFAGRLLLNPFTVNFTYSITDSRYGENSNAKNWKYKDGAKKLYTPQSMGSLGIGYKIPSFLSNVKKGGYIGIDVTYTGKMLVDNYLRLYDGFYNPDIPRLDPKDPENLKWKDAFYKVRLRLNYWFTNYFSTFVDVINLTNYQKGAYNDITPSLGRVVKFGVDIQL